MSCIKSHLEYQNISHTYNPEVATYGQLLGWGNLYSTNCVSGQTVTGW